MIFIGGYCSNEILILLLKKGLKRIIKNFLQPSKPCLAIMEGAVLFGINPRIIESRIAKYTLGILSNNIWDDELHSKLGKKYKYFDEEDKVWRCRDCFDKFIEINQILKLDDEITHSFKTSDPRICNLLFYKSLKSNPIFIFELGMENIGKIILDAKKDYPIGERNFKVTMKFGGTFIDVKAKHDKSGNEVNTTITFN